MKQILLFILCSFSCIGWSQVKLTDLHIGYSANTYKGDFSGYGKYRNALSLGVVLNRDKKISGELAVRLGAVAAESLEFNIPVTSFVKTNYFSLNYGLNIRLLKLKEKLSFHFVPGFGIIRFNPKDFDGNELLEFTDTRGEGEEFSNISIVLPLKLQTRYQLTHKMGLMFETGFLNTRTDYLDNISTLANPDDKDNIFFMNFNLSFLLKKGEKPEPVDEGVL